MCLWRGERALLVLRKEGVWAFPGGKLEAGETLAACAERELMEETGIRARVIGAIGTFDVRVPQHKLRYSLVCHRGTWISGDGDARSDAQDLGWFDLQEICQIPLAVHVLDVLRKTSSLTSN
jgi:8-oxo-dGTP diphosphatase